MISCLVWMLLILPCLWGFCKVPIPCTGIDSKYVSHPRRLKSWYPTGYK